MLTCKQASYLASKKLNKKLTLKEQFDFFMHTMMCRLCREYARDIAVLHNVVQKAGQTGKEILSGSAKLSEQSRKNIKQIVDKAIQSK